MSSPDKEDVANSDDSQLPEIENEEQLAATPLSGDIFAEIDKRLGLLLERANKLENTLNQLNGKCLTENQNLELDLIKDVGDDNRFEDDSDLTGSDSLDPDSSDTNAAIEVHPEDFEKIYLDEQED
ncbi:hypothetical protein AWZ03_002300 [Drosophila navojoa]|uniref:Uncharacterized protein n=1 Tax=Drosophila navojoa TaxID=7232 RepID=A0A484BR48_DRONA|nr:uncharacterized protein LOC108651498 [Drosophila navojoa]TDG51213.1 hypothetical protein AWZ03_002300 [Drosophila navojoa]